jgi:hypothetical protein
MLVLGDIVKESDELLEIENVFLWRSHGEGQSGILLDDALLNQEIEEVS